MESSSWAAASRIAPQLHELPPDAEFAVMVVTAHSAKDNEAWLCSFS